MSEAIEVEVAGRSVTVSNPTKVFFPEHGYTKLDLVRYYVAVGDAAMRQMRDRPVMLQRFPDGVGGNSFYQKRIPKGAPDWLTTMEVRTINGTASNVLVIADLAHLVWAVNLGCIGFHSWPIRMANPDQCDELRIDLDPGPGTTFAMAQEAAAETKRLLGHREPPRRLGCDRLRQDLWQPWHPRVRAPGTGSRQHHRAPRRRGDRTRARAASP